jgi:hypothetical protein
MDGVLKQRKKKESIENERKRKGRTVREIRSEPQSLLSNFLSNRSVTIITVTLVL